MTSNRTCISRVDSYLVERLHSRKATDRENLFTVRIQGVPLGLANLSFSAKSSHWSPCGFPTTGQYCLYRLKWWGVSHSLPGNVSRAGNMPQSSSKGSSHFYCLLGNLFPSLPLGKISGIPHSPRTSQPTDHATFIVSWILLCSAGTIRISNVPRLMVWMLVVLIWTVWGNFSWRKWVTGSLGPPEVSCLWSFLPLLSVSPARQR